MGSTYLRLDQDEVNEQYNQVMLDIFVREAFTSRALRQTDALSKRLVIGLAVGGVEILHGEAASDANQSLALFSRLRLHTRYISA